mmetsp:Transcript_30176/g.49194  ORF Transcript_30176/g.49194 Transcript_30176/m.49194 type:complete len:86 (-) Transcript_30176:259-516(-)
MHNLLFTNRPVTISYAYTNSSSGWIYFSSSSSSSSSSSHGTDVFYLRRFANVVADDDATADGLRRTFAVIVIHSYKLSSSFLPTV